MLVVATAGHVDHGKSTLVRALTGMEPDRGAQARRQGMTIDLGFAWTTLPSGRALGVVDVPGHARFIGNMLAGLGPAPAVLFVVAADAGWQRQSTEHLAAVDALGLTAAVLAVTRSDLADPGPARAESLARLARTSLREVRAVAVSGRSGAGVDRLRTALDEISAEQVRADAHAPVRLWVDRSFSVRGSGTVVTGTLSAGTLRVGDELELGGRRVRVRGLQSLGVPHPEVPAVARVAVNLRGVDRTEVARGDALLTPGAWRHTQLVDVRLTAAVRAGSGGLQLHVGSGAVAVHARPLGADTARLSLPTPLPLRPGDRALLRDLAGQTVLGGVTVLDVDPPPLRRRGAAAARGRELQEPPAAWEDEVRRRGAVREAELVARGLPPDEAAHHTGGWVVDPQRWAAWRDELAALVERHIASFPLDLGLPADTAQRALDLPDACLLAPLTEAAGLIRSSGRIRPPGRRRDLGPVEAGVRALEQRLRVSPFAAPDLPELVRLGLGRRELAAAEHDGRLLRISRDVVLLPDAPARAAQVLAALPQPFSLGTARSALGTSRRVALPLLEHLDRHGATRRLEEDLREVRAVQSSR